MEVKVICCIILIFAINFSMSQIAAVAPASSYDYGYPGAYGYYGYHGYGNPYYSYYSQPSTVSSSGGGGNPAVSAAGGISSSIACANCGFGRN